MASCHVEGKTLLHSIAKGAYVRVTQAFRNRGGKATVTEAKIVRIRGQERVSVFYQTWIRTKY